MIPLKVQIETPAFKKCTMNWVFKADSARFWPNTQFNITSRSFRILKTFNVFVVWECFCLTDCAVCMPVSEIIRLHPISVRSKWWRWQHCWVSLLSSTQNWLARYKKRFPGRENCFCHVCFSHNQVVRFPHPRTFTFSRHSRNPVKFGFEIIPKTIFIFLLNFF